MESVGLHSVPRYGLTVSGMNLPMFAPHPGPVPTDWAPVDACTLPTADQPLRVAEFDDLFATALRAIERPDAAGRARLILAGGADLAERVQGLADAETACCSFFTFALTLLAPDQSDGGDDAAVVALDIEVPAARTDVLGALVERARRVAA